MTTASSAAAACNITNSAASYDTKGNALSRNDFIGKKVCYRYTATRNLESVRAESILAAESCSTVLTTLPARSGVRKVSTAWHAKWRLPVKIAEPNRLTYFAYNGDGGIYCAPSSAAGVLCKQTVRTTTDATGQKGFAAPLTGTPAIWQYTYNQFGQELTAVDPLGKFITTTYYANGNTHTVTNAAGEVITINAYDSGGRPTSMTDADGTIGLTYWPRGWLRTLAEASGTTNYTDDGTGQLTKMLRPDGSYLIYTYDAAHRLTQVKDELGERIVYTHDLTGIITKVETFDANGALTKVRYYDAAESVRTAQFNRQPLFKIEYHGNWCGPDWTGGFKREYGQIGMWEDILTPTDALDRCCYTHDICYWECRCDHGCSVDKRKSCMKICDNALAGCAAASGHRGGLLWLKFNYTDPFKEPDQPTCYGKKD
jgi:YD repeat-containing protein